MCRRELPRDRRPGPQTNELTPWLKKQWWIGEVHAEFVAGLEEVLDWYAQADDEKRPVVGFDETRKQLIAETRRALPRRPGEVERFAYAYARRGVRNWFMFCQPKRGFRDVEVSEQRTMPDLARQLKWLVDEGFPEAERVRVVMDNVKTHTVASRYEIFAPAAARRIAKRLEFPYTPKPGSWLNSAESEWSVFSRQCLDRRIGDEETLKREIKKLEAERKAAGAKIEWRFTTEAARRKLHRLYPSTSD